MQQAPSRTARHEVIVIPDDDDEPVVAAGPSPSRQPQEETGPSPAKAAPKGPPSFFRERLLFLQRNIHNQDSPIAIRLLQTLQRNVNDKAQRKYSLLYWPSNEAALADVHAMAKLSPNFSDIMLYRTLCEAAKTEVDPAKKELAAARVEKERARLESTCREKFQAMLDNERDMADAAKGKGKRKASDAESSDNSQPSPKAPRVAEQASSAQEAGSSQEAGSIQEAALASPVDWSLDDLEREMFDSYSDAGNPGNAPATTMQDAPNDGQANPEGMLDASPQEENGAEETAIEEDAVEEEEDEEEDEDEDEGGEEEEEG